MSGILRTGSKGPVWLRAGLDVDAEIEGSQQGKEAVYEIALWSNGTFEADFGEVEIADRFQIPPSTLLLEAMRRLDEESAAGMPAQELAAEENPALNLALIALNVVGSYAVNLLDLLLSRQRFVELQSEVAEEFPVLDVFSISEEGVVTASGAETGEISVGDLVRGVSLWIEAIFDRLDSALAWRFNRDRLARLLAPWSEQLESHGFSEIFAPGGPQGEPEESAHGSGEVIDLPVPVGCLVLDGEGVIQSLSVYGPRLGNVNPGLLVGKALCEVLPSDIALLADRLMERLGREEPDGERVAVGREVLGCGHQEHLLRVAVVKQASGNGAIVPINRLRDQRRALSPDIERDPLTGSLRDDRSDRLLVANEDFLQAFEGLFARSLMHRHHELLQRFGKKWGLRHAMRLEQVVQRDYGKTLRELESQMALELLSSSIGIFGLGSFEADLGYRDNGLVLIRHHSSPFPGIFSAAAGGSCAILAGFHAAILSYLAGRQLAAREVHCSREPGDTCLFVVATDDRLTKLLIATPGSEDHKLLSELTGSDDPRGDT